MSIRYTVSERKNLINPAEPKKWFANAHSIGEITLREIAKQISLRSTVNTIDVMAVLESFLQLVPEEILRGNIVRLGDFGSFRLTIHSEGSDTEEDFTPKHIASCHLHFHSGVEVGKALKDVKYEKLEL